jgi:ceramide glucosyltransferase
VQPHWWPVFAFTAVLRAAAALEVCAGVLREKTGLRAAWLIMLQDFLSFAFWVAGFFGNTIVWRGRRYRLEADGRFLSTGSACARSRNRG